MERRSRMVEKVEKHEWLQDLAEVGRAHQTRDEALCLATGTTRDLTYRGVCSRSAHWNLPPILCFVGDFARRLSMLRAPAPRATICSSPPVIEMFFSKCTIAFWSAKLRWKLRAAATVKTAITLATIRL